METKTRNTGRVISGLILAATGVVALLAAEASASTLLSLKQVQVTSAGQVDILFDGKLNRNQLKTEFFNDIVQISLTDTSVYPAKISSVSGGILTKIFAYQYAPKLVRCRFTVKGKAESLKDQIKIIPNGKILTVRFEDAAAAAHVDRVATNAAQAVREADKSKKAATTEKGAPKLPAKAEKSEKAENSLADEERSLLERVLRASDKPAEKPVEKAQVEKTIEKPAEKPVEKPQAEARTHKNEASKPLANGKPLLSPLKVMGKMGLLIAFMLLTLIGVKKLLKGDSRLSRLAKSSLGKKKMIEVLSSHHLGPKKSIAVVKVAGRLLVLGVTNESINLIAQLNGQNEESVANLDLAELEELGLQSAPQPAAPKPRNEPSIRPNNPVSPSSGSARGPQYPAGAAAHSGMMTAGMNASKETDLFSKFLDSEASKPATYSPVKNSVVGNPARNSVNSVRAQIRSRMEGLKQL